jgi:hypothetical protein
MDAAKMVDPAIWAQSGGLIGLVIFALFAALGIFLWAQLKIYEMHRADTRVLLQMHAEERETWGSIIDIRQKETNEAIKAMALAINDLNARARRYTNGNGHE